MTPLSKHVRDLYQAVAREDLMTSLQDESALQDKARSDAKMIGDVAGLKILEVGPGRGHLAKMLSGKGAHVDACDLVPDYLEQLAGDISGSTFTGDIQTLSVSEQYDLVIMCDVLEHVLRPADALISARMALKKGTGRLFVRSPGNESLIAYAQLLGCPHEMVHLRTYSRSDLRREARAAGFAAIRVRSISSHREPRFTLLASEKYWAYRRSSLQAGYKTEPRERASLQIQVLEYILNSNSIGRSRAPFLFPIAKVLQPLVSKPGEIVLRARRGQD